MGTDAKLGSGGFLLFKDYQTIDNAQVGQAAFYLKIDVVDATDDDVATIDLVQDGKNVIASNTLKRSDFYVNNQFQRFVLDFEVAGKASIEPRIRWLNKAAMTVQTVLINTTDP